MTINWRYFVLVTLVTCLGCSRMIDRSFVIGRYEANHRKAIDNLQLNSDGTYVHYFKTHESKEFKASDKWEFEYTNGKPTITFSKFSFGLSGYGTAQPGFWIVQVERSLTGDIRLCIDPDLGYYYVKQRKN